MRWWMTCCVVLGLGCAAQDEGDEQTAGTGSTGDASSSGEASTGAAESSSESGDAALDRGQVVFMETCARDSCHGADGLAGPAPNLDVQVPRRDDTRLRTVIQLGTGQTGDSTGAMPGQNLQDQPLQDVIVYLRATFP